MSENTRSARSAKALRYARTALKGAATVAALSPFPQVKSIFKLADGIIQTLENTDKVETVFANLAAQVCRTLRFIADTLRNKDIDTAKRLSADLKDLQEVLKSIRQLVETQQARSYFERLFSGGEDAAQAIHCSEQLKSALEFFSLRSTVQIRSSIHDLQGVIDDLREDVAALKIPPTPGPSTTSSQIVKPARKKSDVGHKTKDSRKADQKNSTDSTQKPAKAPPASPPKVRRSKSMDDVKTMSDPSSDISKSNAKADANKSSEEKSTKVEGAKKPPPSSKAKNKNDRKPKADNKKDKSKSQATDKRNKGSTGTQSAKTAGEAEKKQSNQHDEGHAKPKDKWKETSRPKGMDMQSKGSKDGKEDSSNGKKPRASKNGEDKSAKSPEKPSCKPKDISNLKSSKVPNKVSDKNKAEKPKESRIQGDNPMPVKLDRSQSDSPNEKRCRPNDLLKRANSTGNVDKERKSRDPSASKASKASNEESTPDIRKDKLQASGDADNRSASPHSERSPSRASSSNRHDERSDENKLNPTGKIEQGRRRCVSTEGHGKKPAKKNKADDDAAPVSSSSAPKTHESVPFVVVISPPSSR